MTISILKQSLIISSLISFVGFPVLTVGLMFYYLFSGTSKTFLFNTVGIMIGENNQSFSFQFQPQYLLIVFGVFAITFILSFLFSSIFSNK
jgi:hypothetical protein